MVVPELLCSAPRVHDVALDNGPRALIRERRVASKKDIDTAARRVLDRARPTVVVAGPRRGDRR